MAEQIIDLNNKTPQDLVKIFFDGTFGDDEKFHFKYNDKVRIDILDSMKEELRQYFLNDKYAQQEINFDVQNLSLTDNVVRKMIQKQVINWNHFSKLASEAKLRLLKEENLDFISDSDKDILRQLASKNPLEFLCLPIAYRKALNAKLGLGLNSDESFENIVIKEYRVDKLNNLQSEMWGFMSPSSAGYCWANATWQAVHKTYPDTNQVKKYAADIKAKFPYAYNDKDGYSGAIVYSCLYESQKTDKPIVSFDLTEKIGDSTEMCMKTVLHKSGKTWSNKLVTSYDEGLLRDHALDFRELIKAVIDDNCPVVVGKGNHAQYLGDGLDKRKQFLRCAVRFLYSNRVIENLLSTGTSGIFEIVDVANFAISSFLVELLAKEDVDKEAINDKIDNALKNIKDPVFRCYEKIKFGQFFCEEFIRLYIDEHDKNKELYPDPNDLLDAVLKDFVENHIDKNLFEKDKTEEKPIETSENDNEQQKNQGKPQENSISSTKPENPPNTEEKETLNQKSDSHQETNDQKHEPDYKVQENLDKPPENPIDVPKAKEINFDQEINKFLTSERESGEIESLKTTLETKGKFEDFIRIFKDRFKKELDGIKGVFENYFNNPKKNQKPDLEKIKTQLKNYVWLCYPEGKAKDEAMQQINNLDKVSTWQKFLEIIIGILKLDKCRILQPETTKILAKIKKLASNDKFKLCDTKNDRV